MYEWRDVDSSCISRIGFAIDKYYEICRYNPNLKGTIRVVFCDNRVYDYNDVEYCTFEDFANAPSVGRFYQHEIKGIYESESIDKCNCYPFNNPNEKVDNVILEGEVGVDEEDEEFFKDLVEGTDKEEKQMFVVISSSDEPKVVSRETLFKIINSNKMNTGLNVYRLGDKIIDW